MNSESIDFIYIIIMMLGTYTIPSYNIYTIWSSASIVFFSFVYNFCRWQLWWILDDFKKDKVEDWRWHMKQVKRHFVIWLIFLKVLAYVRKTYIQLQIYIRYRFFNQYSIEFIKLYAKFFFLHSESGFKKEYSSKYIIER